jgi:hypothetical protein
VVLLLLPSPSAVSTVHSVEPDQNQTRTHRDLISHHGR